MVAKYIDHSNESDHSSKLSSYSDAYSRDVAGLLARIAPRIDQATLEFVDRFYAAVQHRPSSAKIINRLHPSEFEHLRRKQAGHLRLLMSPKTTSAAHFIQAQRVGRTHAMIGVELPSLLEAYHLYLVEIQQMLRADSADGLTAQEQERLLRALQLRLMLDMEAQITSYALVEAEMADFTSSFGQCVLEAGNLADLLYAVMQKMTSLDGIVGCLFLRPDRDGVLQIEAADQTLGQQYADSMERHNVPFINIYADKAGGRGPDGKAWRSGQIRINESYECDQYVQPWKEIAQELGFRSSASIPLLDETGQSFALLSLYSHWPGFFDYQTRQNFLRQVQQTLGHAIPRLERGRVIPEQRRHEYRRRLVQGSVRLFYQPIIDLKSGHVAHVEALARMYGVGDSIIPPTEFLPAFGKADLLRLFEIGVSQASRDVRRWQEDAQRQIPVSLNLPTEGLIDQAYRDILFEAIEAGEIEASHLRLELLETRDPIDHEQRDARLVEFRQAGIALVQDDLGSGHSSLLRMDRIAFDEVKIDQGLVRNALNAPQRALEFIYHLTRLAHGFGVKVTVEGLESLGLIEAAAILGADHGQGYGIARPMPAADLSSWSAQWKYEVDRERPRTALGALAGYLLWDQQLAALDQWPDLIEEFIRAPSLVQHYISFNGLENTSLRSLLENTLDHALRGRNSAVYEHTKNELIKQLSEQSAAFLAA